MACTFIKAQISTRKPESSDEDPLHYIRPFHNDSVQ